MYKYFSFCCYICYATPSVISCDTCNRIYDKITALLSNCHLNRKFAYRNDRNDASEACTKAHRIEAPVIDVPREI